MSSEATVVPVEQQAPVVSTVPSGVVRVRSEYICSVAEVAARVLTANPLALSAPAAAPIPAEGAAPADVGATAPKQRGQNKGSEREHVRFERSGARPTFEGELNFLDDDVLMRIKSIVRPVWAKRQRDAPEDDMFARAIAEGIAEAEAEAKAAAAAAKAAAAPVPEAPAELKVERSPQAPVAAPAEEEAEDPELVALRAKRKAELAAMVEPVKTSEDQKRDNAAKRDQLFRDKLILAPLTTVGNLPYRRICAEYGADVTLSEMALCFNMNKTQKSEWSLLRRHKSEGLFGLQVAVSRPGDAIQWAKSIEASGFSYDYVDINCGCPVDLIVRQGCGCGLWERKGKLKEVVKALTDWQSKPVTIKCRIGPDEADPQLHKHIGEYEEWGAAAVTIHGRSRKQRYTKLANWSYIEQCSRLTNLPVVGNGDIMNHSDFEARKADAPNVSSQMLGRGALIKPWVFKEIKEKTVIDISSKERFEMLKKFCEYGITHWGSDEKGVQTTRRFLLEWLSFLHRYVPAGVVEEGCPQRINDRPPAYKGRDELETLMASDNVADWIKISEMLLGPCGDRFRFTPKHKSNSYSTTRTGAPSKEEGGLDEG